MFGIYDILGPAARDRRARAKEYWSKAVPQEWHDKISFHERLLIKGSSFTPDRLFDTEPVDGSWKEMKEAGRTSPNGKWVYVNRILPQGGSLTTASGNRRGEVRFDDDVVIPVLFDGVQRPWMSITPQEIFTLRPALRLATGTVVLGGLGMGWLLRKVAAKRSVKRIIVVEKCQDLLHWFGYDLCKKYNAEVIVDDVHNQLGKHGTDAAYLLDIWPGYGGNGEKMRRIARQKGLTKTWAWGAAYA